MNYLKKNWSNILMVVLIILLIIPQTRTPIKVFVHKLIAFSPSVTDEEDREGLSSFDWMLVSHKGEHINLKDLKGKVVLINFWATWCPPCIAEMPSLQALYSDYKEDVVFLFVSNEEAEKVQAFMQKQQYDLPVYQQGTASPKELESSSIPATFLLDKSGKIVISKIGSADWNSEKVRKQLDELIAQ